MSNQKLVWDLPLRLFHWLLVLSIIILYLTSEVLDGFMQYHIYTGYFVLALTVFRIIWGFVGTQHALFKHFLPSPKAISQYLKAKPARESVGHNPLGSIMVFVMLLLILVQAVSGLFVSDDAMYSGPYFGAYSEAFEKLMNKVHHKNFNLILLAILVHVAAVVFYQRFKKHQLIQAMITGKKDAALVSEQQEIKDSKIGTAALLCFLVVSFVYWLVVINAPVIEEVFF